MAGQPDAYEQGIDSAGRTVGVAETLVGLVREPVTYFWQRRSIQQTLRDGLGEWLEEAVDSKGRWLQPVLRTAAFEKHLVEHNAHFQPSGSCQASFGWTHLLYALDVRPGCGVLTWRLPSSRYDPTTTKQIDLAIDGQALCHIINLYRSYNERYMEGERNEGSAFEEHGCRMQFGLLKLSRANTRFSLVFEAGTAEELSSPRKPFCYYAPCVTGTHLRFEPEVVVARYFNTIHHGISEASAMLPPATSPWKARMAALLSAGRFLSGQTAETPLLLTNTWLGEAGRIKRRITTDGGEDVSLATDIFNLISKSPNILKELQWMRSWQDYLWEVLSSYVMSNKNRFQFMWSSRDHSEPFHRAIVQKVVETHLRELTIATLNAAPVGSWKHSMSEVFDDFYEIMHIHHVWKNEPGLRLELTPESEVWNADCCIKG